MDNHRIAPPLPVDGVVFDRPAVKTLLLIALSGIFFFFGVCASSAAIDGRVGWKGLLVGVGLMLGTTFGIVRELRSWWVRRRLIVGSECIQVVEYLRGGDTVILQIPYANIAEFKLEESGLWVGIDLHCLDDPDTYAPNEDFERNRKSDGRHYRVLVGYRKGARAIASAMEKAYRT